MYLLPWAGRGWIRDGRLASAAHRYVCMCASCTWTGPYRRPCLPEATILYVYEYSITILPRGVIWVLAHVQEWFPLGRSLAWFSLSNLKLLVRGLAALQVDADVDWQASHCQPVASGEAQWLVGLQRWWVPLLGGVGPLHAAGWEHYYLRSYCTIRSVVAVTIVHCSAYPPS